MKLGGGGARGRAGARARERPHRELGGRLDAAIRLAPRAQRDALALDLLADRVVEDVDTQVAWRALVGRAAKPGERAAARDRAALVLDGRRLDLRQRLAALLVGRVGQVDVDKLAGRARAEVRTEAASGGWVRRGAHGVSEGAQQSRASCAQASREREEGEDRGATASARAVRARARDPALRIPPPPSPRRRGAHLPVLARELHPALEVRPLARLAPTPPVPRHVRAEGRQQRMLGAKLAAQLVPEAVGRRERRLGARRGRRVRLRRVPAVGRRLLDPADGQRRDERLDRRV